MRLSIDCRYIQRRPSGISAYVQALIDRLPVLAPDDEFLFWTHPDARGRLARSPRSREHIVASPANGLGTLLWPSRLVDLRGFDLHHAPFNILGRGLPCPAVVTVHDLMWLLRPELSEGLSPATPGQMAFFYSGIWRALKQARRVVAISQATADSIHLVAPEVSPRVRVIHHGIEPEFKPPADPARVREALRGELQLDDYFLVVGQNSPSKNHRAVVEAFAAARLDPRVKLVLVQRLYATRGHPLSREVPLDQLARDLGVSERVRFVSGLSREQVVRLYQGALALVQYSRFEGFGMPVLEAMACGTPVIASDIAPLVEVIGGAGIHVSLQPSDLADAFRRVASDPSLRADLGLRGVDRSLAFSWDKCARLHLEVFQEACR